MSFRLALKLLIGFLKDGKSFLETYWKILSLQVIGGVSPFKLLIFFFMMKIKAELLKPYLKLFQLKIY